MALRLALTNREESAEQTKAWAGLGPPGRLSRASHLCTAGLEHRGTSGPKSAPSGDAVSRLRAAWPVTTATLTACGHQSSLWLPLPLTPCLAHSPSASGRPHRFLLPGQPLPVGPLKPLRASPGGEDQLRPWRMTLPGRLLLDLGEVPTSEEAHGLAGALGRVLG